jgi:hypothetical protein
MAMENHRFTRASYDLNFRVGRLSARTTEIAFESQKAAEETSRITRINVQLLLVRYPTTIFAPHINEVKFINRSPRHSLFHCNTSSQSQTFSNFEDPQSLF